MSTKISPLLARIYSFQFFWIFAIILPVLYPYYASLGMDMHEFFQLQAMFGFSVALFEVPTGYFSDYFGRKVSLSVGGFLSGISYLVLTQATGFYGLLLHEFLLGVALSFVSGTDVAILFDSLPPKSTRNDSSRLLGFHQMAAALGESSAAVLCTLLLLSFSYKAIIGLQAIISWIPFFIALSIPEPPTPRKEHLEFKKVKILWRQLLHEQQELRLLILHFVVWMLATFIAIWTIQKYWQEHHIPLAWFGILWAASTLSIGFSGLVARQLEHCWSSRHILLGVGILSIVALIVMGLSAGLLGVVMGFLLYVARGLNQVVARDLLNQSIQPELRATANSMVNFLFRISFALLGPGIGWAIDRWSLNFTLLTAGGIFAILFLLITFPLWKLLKNSPMTSLI